jgi:hypothetical protein
MGCRLYGEGRSYFADTYQINAFIRLLFTVCLSRV